jgi:hypothetical protein
MWVRLPHLAYMATKNLEKVGSFILKKGSISTKKGK